jgi:hypothetical protein
MVRSAATPRVSNHLMRHCSHLCDKARGGTEHNPRTHYFSPTLNGGSLPGGTVSSAIASNIATIT